MQYRTDRYGNPLSVLGYGCMRFTQSGGKVDVNKAEQQSRNERLPVDHYFVAFYADVYKHRKPREEASQSGYDKGIPRYELYKYSGDTPKCRAHEHLKHGSVFFFHINLRT